MTTIEQLNARIEELKEQLREARETTKEYRRAYESEQGKIYEIMAIVNRQA